MAIFTLRLSIGAANASQDDEVEIPDEDLAACETDDERDKLIDGYLQDWMNNYIDAGIWEKEE